jgi:hypothetical protein
MPRQIMDIPLASIECKTIPINKKALWFAMQMLMEKALFPPVKLERSKNGLYKLTGGRHRFAAHKLLERKTIRAWVSVENPGIEFIPQLDAFSSTLPEVGVQ